MELHNLNLKITRLLNKSRATQFEEKIVIIKFPRSYNNSNNNNNNNYVICSRIINTNLKSYLQITYIKNKYFLIKKYEEL